MVMQQLTDVWTLETPAEETAIFDLNLIIDAAYNHDHKAQRYLRKLWDMKWVDIKSRLEVEGSAWYVWWMDGVRKHLENMVRERKNESKL